MLTILNQINFAQIYILVNTPFYIENLNYFLQKTKSDLFRYCTVQIFHSKKFNLSEI